MKHTPSVPSSLIFTSAQILQLASLLERHARKKLKNQRDMTFAQFKVLLLTESKCVSSQSEMARMLDLSPAAISQVIGTLAHKKWLQRKTKSTNRRENHITLTALGRQALGLATASMHGSETDLYQIVEPEKLEIFNQVTLQLLQKLEADR